MGVGAVRAQRHQRGHDPRHRGLRDVLPGGDEGLLRGRPGGRGCHGGEDAGASELRPRANFQDRHHDFQVLGPHARD